MVGRNAVSVRVLSVPDGTEPSDSHWIMGDLEIFVHGGGDLFLRVHDEKDSDYTIVIAHELLSGLVSKALREEKEKDEKDGVFPEKKLKDYK